MLIYSVNSISCSEVILILFGRASKQIILTLSEQQNCHLTLYEDPFAGPNRTAAQKRKVLNPDAFTRLHNCLSETGSVFMKTKERDSTAEDEASVYVDLQKQIIEIVQENSRISVRDLRLQVGAIRSFVWRVLSDAFTHTTLPMCSIFCQKISTSGKSFATR
ncbi:hypothetical protein PGB90_004915 [Kerria lacca]